MNFKMFGQRFLNNTKHIRFKPKSYLNNFEKTEIIMSEKQKIIITLS